MANTAITATRENIAAYLKEKEIFPSYAELIVENIREIKESAEGYVNPIYRIRTNNGDSVILKQVTSMPISREEAKKIGEDIAADAHDLDTSRMRYEIAVMIFWNAICPGICPDIYLLDEVNNIIVMEDLSHLSLLRYDFARMNRHPLLAEKMGQFFARDLFYSSDLNLTKYRKQGIMRYFNNPEYRALEPHLFHTCVIITDERIMPKKTWNLRKRIMDNPVIQKEILRLRLQFTENPECLIHTDLHASNVMVDEKDVKIIDTEFAGFGPLGQDLGRFTASYLLNFCSWYGDDMIHTEDEKAKYREVLLDGIINLYCQFEMELRRLIEANKSTSYYLRTMDVDTYIRQHLNDALAFTVLNAASRIGNRGLCHDLERLVITERIYPQLLVLKTCEDILSGKISFNCIFEFTDYLRGLAEANPYESLL